MTERGKTAKASKHRILTLERENAALRAENDTLASRVAELKPRAIDSDDDRELSELQEVLNPKPPREELKRVNRAAARKR